jgi:hypothetical protein
MRLLFAALAALALAGCVTPAPKSFIEEVALAEAGAEAALQTIGDLTCTQGADANGACLAPGKPLQPAQAIDLIGKVAKVRQALKASVRLPESGGECLGASRTGRDCLMAAQQVLLEVETYLAQQGRKP